MRITRDEIGFGSVARTGRQELHDYGIVRVSDRLQWALLDDSPLIKHRINCFALPTPIASNPDVDPSRLRRSPNPACQSVLL